MRGERNDFADLGVGVGDRWWRCPATTAPTTTGAMSSILSTARRRFCRIDTCFQRERPGRQPALSLTSFVIASPSARRQIDVGAMGGRALNDDRWQAANASGLMPIESHGWDFTITPPCRRWCSASSAVAIFWRLIPSPSATCMRAAANFIESRAGRRPSLFAYHGRRRRTTCAIATCPPSPSRFGTIAAFGGQSDYLTRDSDRWYLPRFVFGPDWNSRDSLLALFDGAC